MRESCLDCARKHLAQALVLIHEMHMGYPAHKWLAVGHMAEASDELLRDYPTLAHEVRAARLTFMENDDLPVDIMDLIDRISMMEESEDMMEESKEE